MNEWIAEATHRLAYLRGPFVLPSEEHLIEVVFNDGHADHVTSLAQLRDALSAAKQQWLDADQDRGDRQAKVNQIIIVHGYIVNARRSGRVILEEKQNESGVDY